MGYKPVIKSKAMKIMKIIEEIVFVLLAGVFLLVVRHVSGFEPAVIIGLAYLLARQKSKYDEKDI